MTIAKITATILIALKTLSTSSNAFRSERISYVTKIEKFGERWKERRLNDRLPFVGLRKEGKEKTNKIRRYERWCVFARSERRPRNGLTEVRLRPRTWSVIRKFEEGKESFRGRANFPQSVAFDRPRFICEVWLELKKKKEKKKKRKDACRKNNAMNRKVVGKSSKNTDRTRKIRFANCL